MSDKYVPEFPSEITVEWLWRELQRISIALAAVQDGHLDVTYAEPAKPREGDIRYADGVQWNPANGIGKGLYVYDGEIWRPFG